MTWNSEQIELCKQLYSLMPKREPKVGEWWYSTEPEEVVFLTEDKGRHVAGFNIISLNRLDQEVMNLAYADLLHPLYSHSELLEMILNKVKSWKHDSLFDVTISKDEEHYEVSLVETIRIDTDSILGNEKADNILTALLKLAIEVTEGK